MDVKKVIKLQEESYDKWFERWYEKYNLPQEIIKAAKQGFRGYSFNLNDKDRSEYEVRRMKDKRFITKLEGKLEGFSIQFQESEERGVYLMGNRISSNWTDEKIIITWGGNDGTTN